MYIKGFIVDLKAKKATALKNSAKCRKIPLRR